MPSQAERGAFLNVHSIQTNCRAYSVELQLLETNKQTIYAKAKKTPRRGVATVRFTTESILRQRNNLCMQLLKKNWYLISEVRGVIFATPPFEGSYSGGELLFHYHLFTSDQTKLRSNRCKTMIFRSKNETYSVRDELPGELIEGGSYFFNVSATGRRELIKRGLFKGELIKRGSYSRGELIKRGELFKELIKEIRYKLCACH